MHQYGRATIVLAEVKDAATLAHWIKHREATLRTVAETATRIGQRERRGGKNAVSVSHATIGHLLTGVQKSVRPERAKLIEKALDVPVGSLFTYTLAPVSPRSGQKIPA